MKRLIIFTVVLSGCIDPYSPPEIQESDPVLVVDGFININDWSTIQLTRSQNLLSEAEPQIVNGANVWLEDESGNKFYFIELGLGIYRLPPQVFSAPAYRLIIQTDLNEYESSFERVVTTPAIDSITWSITDDLGVQLYVNTHDENTPVGYYRWTFDETWLYQSKFQSIYTYDYTTRSVGLRSDDIFHCYRYDESKDILTESTTRLSENVVYRFPIHYIKQNSERLRMKYSMLVKQFAITKDAFSYWQQVKKTTEDLGTLFGPLPAQIIGNIKNTGNPSEPVVGYFSIGTMTTKRIFITSLEVPPPLFYDRPYENCEEYELFNADVPSFSGPYLLTGGIPSLVGPGILGYYYAIPRCVDCRITGGTTTKPDFWE